MDIAWAFNLTEPCNEAVAPLHPCNVAAGVVAVI